MNPPLRTIAWRVPLLLAGVLGLVMVLGLEKYLIFFPDRVLEMTPGDFAIPYQDVRFPASDGVGLHGWIVPTPAARLTLVWFHGNAGNISHRVENLGLLRRALPINIFIFDYRGYGLSDGRLADLSEEATYSDADGALAYLRSRTDLRGTRLVYFGRSLGAAVAVEMARRQRPAGLILETPFTSIREMARVALPFLPIGGLVRTRYDSLAKIPEIEAPLLVLHGDQDDVVPFAQGRRLYEAARDPKTFYTIRGAHHNDTFVVGGRAYFDVWAQFLSGL